MRRVERTLLGSDLQWSQYMDLNLKTFSCEFEAPSPHQCAAAL